jgi:hypothetical protein
MDVLLEPWRKPDAEPLEAKLITDSDALNAGADKIVAARVLTTIARDRRMSLLGKMQALTESAQDFNKETEAVLDGIAEKIVSARAKRDAAKEKHHGYYDGIVKGIEDSVVVIDRLSNGPLPQDGGK